LAETGIEADSIKGSIGIIAVSPDSITIAIGGLDGRIRLYQPKIFNKQFFASFTSDTLIKQLGEPIYFTDNSFNNPTYWHWDFGDGTTSTEQHPVHYYKTKGLFSVKLIASNGTQIDTLTRKDFIRIQIPVVANFDSNITQDTVPLNVQFINQSQGDIKNYSWTFGNKLTSKEENPTILFDKWGEYDVSLKVADGYFSDSILVREKIKVIPPAIPYFTNKLEKRFVQNNQSYYGIDGLQTFDGNFAFIAKIYDVETYYYDDEYHYKEIYRNKMLIKMDSVGNVIWGKIVTKGKKIAQLLDSCLIIVDDSVTSRNEIYVAKYNQDGEFLWERFHRTQTLNSDSPTNIKATRDSGYVISADSKYYEEYRSSIFKTDKNGVQTMYKANLYGRYTDVIEIDSGYYFLIYHNPNNKNIMISKINNSGKVLASVICGDRNNIFPKNTVLNKKSNLIIAGWLTNTDNKQYSYMLKVDSLGEKICEYIGDSPNSCYYSISSISDTLFAATGNFNNQLGVDIINNQGELVNSVRFPERNGVINSIVTTKDNDLFLTGSITPPYKLSQLYTLLLKHPYIITSVEDEQTENIANPEQPFNIFPNPTNSTATLQYKIETLTHLKIELIDFMGMRVSEIENSFKEAGEYSSLINFESLAITKGIYFVRFIANGNVFICKLVYV
ncbi:MAG TPA: PKD domain-containing protein, partial [Candidatus Kapabacteria bacterium]|nr:PKD domain-containing protein [Candidatus Kapabacteria bacterium]